MEDRNMQDQLLEWKMQGQIITRSRTCTTTSDFTPNLVLHFPVLHFPPSDLHRLVVLHFPVTNFTPIVLCWSSFFRSSIFSHPGMGCSTVLAENCFKNTE